MNPLLEQLGQSQARAAACRQLVELLRDAGLDPETAATLEEQVNTLQQNLDKLGDAFTRLHQIIVQAQRMRQDTTGGDDRAH